MDESIFHLINQQWTHPALDLFMAAISNVDIWIPLIVVAVLIPLIWGGFKGRAMVFCLACVFLANSSVTNSLKQLVDRRRPKQAERVRMVVLTRTRPEFLTLFRPVRIRYSDAGDQQKSGPSFPSGHVTNNITVAIVLALFYRRWGWLYFFLAAAIGYSRIYLGAHWPSDVLATVFLAAGETFLELALLEWLWGSLGRIALPKLYLRHPRLIGEEAA